MTSRRSLIPVLLAFFAIGCANGIELDPPSAALNASGKADGVGAENDGPPVPELSKRYALLFDSTIKTQHEDGNDPPETVLTSILADVIVEQQSERILLNIQPCQVVLPTLDGRQPEVTPDVIQRIKSIVVEGRLRPQPASDMPTRTETTPAADPLPSDGLDDEMKETQTDGTDAIDTAAAGPSNAAATAQYELMTEIAAFVGGAQLEVPLSDPLPEDDDDPRLHDLDEDGRPGISIHIGGFSAYASFRLTFDMLGHVGDGAIEGESIFELDSQIVGDNIPFVDAAKRAQTAAEETVILSQSHRFSMTPMPVDLSVCGFEL